MAKIGGDVDVSGIGWIALWIFIAMFATCSIAEDMDKIERQLDRIADAIELQEGATK